MNDSAIVFVALVSVTFGIFTLLIALAIRRWRRITWVGRIAWIIIFAGFTLGSIGFYSGHHYLQKSGFYVMFVGMFAWIANEYFCDRN